MKQPKKQPCGHAIKKQFANEKYKFKEIMKLFVNKLNNIFIL